MNGGEKLMKVQIHIDPSYTEPELILRTAAMTRELSDLVRTLSEDPPLLITGSQYDRIELLEPADLIRIYAASGKVFAVTAKGEYQLRLRLYELEEQLDRHQFVRISHSEIIHLKKVESFDLSLTGTICVRLSDGTASFVSRRYVAKIKKILGL